MSCVSHALLLLQRWLCWHVDQIRTPACTCPIHLLRKPLPATLPSPPGEACLPVLKTSGLDMKLAIARDICKQCSKIAFIIANKSVSLTCWDAAAGLFMGRDILIHSCPGAVLVKRLTWSFHLLPRGPSLERGCVKSDALTWARIGLSHHKVWSCDTLMSPQCRLVDTGYMTPSCPRLLSVGTSSKKNCQHFRGRAKLRASSNGWQEDSEAQNGGARFSEICDTIQSRRLFVGILSKTAEFRRAEEYLAERGFVYQVEAVT